MEINEEMEINEVMKSLKEIENKMTILLNRALKEYAAFEKELKEIQQKGFSFS